MQLCGVAGTIKRPRRFIVIDLKRSYGKIYIQTISVLCADATDVDDLITRGGMDPSAARAVWDRLGYEMENEAYRWTVHGQEALLLFLEVCDSLGLLYLQP